MDDYEAKCREIEDWVAGGFDGDFQRGCILIALVVCALLAIAALWALGN
jgi:hypothetical protein